MDVKDKILRWLIDNPGRPFQSGYAPQLFDISETELIQCIKNINDGTDWISIRDGQGKNLYIVQLRNGQGTSVKMFLEKGGYTKKILQEIIQKEKEQQAKEQIEQRQQEKDRLEIDKLHKELTQLKWTQWQAWLALLISAIAVVISIFKK